MSPRWRAWMGFGESRGLLLPHAHGVFYPPWLIYFIALDFKMFCQEGEYWEVLQFSLSAVLFQTYCRWFYFFFLTWCETERVTLEVMRYFFWFWGAVLALTGSHCLHYHLLARCVSQSARDNGLSEISDSAPTCRKDNCALLTLY